MGEEEHMEEDEPEIEAVPPTVKLTAEEKKAHFFTGGTPDMTEAVINVTFKSFSVPTKKEGFDELRYAWNKSQKCEEYLKQWILTRKRTTRVEDLKPGDWFLAEKMRFYAARMDFQAKLKVYNAGV